MSTAIENDVLKGCRVATNEDKSSTFYIKDGKVVAECRKSKVGGTDIESWYNADGKLHRDGDLPAVIYYENGQKFDERWYRDGEQHRDGDLPVVIYYKNGQKIGEYWYRDDKRHRDGDLPAVIYYENGQETKKLWYHDGKEIAPPKPVDNAALIAEIENDLANIAAKLATLKTGIKK